MLCGELGCLRRRPLLPHPCERICAQFGGRHQLFIGVSTPLVWAATRPPPPVAPEEQAGAVDIPDSASELAAAARAPSVQEGSTAGGLPAQSRAHSMVGAGLGAASEAGLTSPRTPAGAATPALDPYVAAAALGALTDRDAPRRAPCLSARNVHEVRHACAAL